MSLVNNVGKFRKLARRECCNYIDGDCIATDCKCVIDTSITSILCKYFIKSVLPLNKELEAHYNDELYSKLCKDCNKRFTSYVKNKLYCPDCTVKNNKERYKKYNRKRNSIEKRIPTTIYTKSVPLNRTFGDVR